MSNLVALAKATGVRLDWRVSGEGPRRRDVDQAAAGPAILPSVNISADQKQSSDIPNLLGRLSNTDADRLFSSIAFARTAAASGNQLDRILLTAAVGDFFAAFTRPDLASPLASPPPSGLSHAPRGRHEKGAP